MSFRLNPQEQSKYFQSLGLKQLSVNVTPEINPTVPIWMTPNAKYLIKEEFGWRCVVFQAIPFTREAWDEQDGKFEVTFNGDGMLEEFIKKYGSI